MSKHTKGPWHYCGEDRGGCRCMQIWSAHHPIATVESGEWGDYDESGELLPYGRIPEDTAKANARLIAAVPELLRALKGLTALMMDPYFADVDPDEAVSGDALRQARAAIAKAEED